MIMQRARLGRTGLRVGVAGLGCGGHSRLGQAYGASVADSVAVIHAGLDLGIDLIDTAQNYETEGIVGEAIVDRRDRVILSTKQQIVQPGSRTDGDAYRSPSEFAAGVDDSLRRLRTDRIDILHLHGVMAHQYGYCRDELLPVLHRLREEGKIRFLGLTERFIKDTTHAMLDRALLDDCWDVMMVGFNLLNPSARTRILARTAALDIGVLNMFAVRRALSRPEAAVELVHCLVAEGHVDPAAIDPDAPLDFLIAPDVASSVTEAAYRFCRHEPGIDVVLTGTGKISHLQENVAAINGPPLPRAVREQLANLFGAVDSISGN